MYLTKSLRRELRVLRYEFKVFRQHRGALKRARQFRGQTGLKLNVGSGPHRREGWVHLDRHAAADLPVDLREPLPFSDGAAREIYSEHFFEHLDYPKQATAFLKECLRVLEPGGLLSFGVPDTEWPLLAYAEKADGYFEAARGQFHPAWCNTRLHHLNFHFRQGNEHKYAYDFETLKAVLEKAKLENVTRREFDPAQDSADRKLGTLYVTARKPQG